MKNKSFKSFVFIILNSIVLSFIMTFTIFAAYVKTQTYSTINGSISGHEYTSRSVNTGGVYQSQETTI